MKKSLVPILCMVAIVAFAGMLLAETNLPTPQVSSKPPMVNKRKAMGIVASVDPVANIIALKVKENTISFQAYAGTKILMAGKEVKLTDVKPNSKATIFYTGGGKKRVAAEIIVQVFTVPGANGSKPMPQSTTE